MFTAGTSEEILKLIQENITNQIEYVALETILSKLDAIRQVSYTKVQNLPIEKIVVESGTSLTPDVCTAKGSKVTSLKPGVCSVSYQLLGESGKAFTVIKQFVFKR